MALEVIWSDPGLADVEEIIDFMRPHSEVAARRFGEAVFASVEILKDLPFIGPIFPGDPVGNTREIACGTYRIFYNVDEVRERVEILAVWHASLREPDPRFFLDRLDRP